MAQILKPNTIEFGKHKLTVGERTLIMGIINVTPDSFSDGGQFFKTDQAIEQGKSMFKDGAHIIDIGGESTRPFSDPVSIDEELKRVIPVIEQLAESVSVPISIDTYKPEVAEAAINAGASIINDITALKNPNMIKIAVKYNVPVVLMHMLNEPKTMQIAPVYQNLIGDIKTFLSNTIDKAIRAGINPKMIFVDPGIGFGKTVENNLSIIKHLFEFGSLGAYVLVGPSRKAFIRKTLNIEQTDQYKADIGTQAVIASCALNGADVVRVHNVPLAMATLALIDSIRHAK